MRPPTSRLTLRMRLTVLYGALFSASIVAVVATVEVFWPDFLRAHGSQQAAPGTSGPRPRTISLAQRPTRYRWSRWSSCWPSSLGHCSSAG